LGAIHTAVTAEKKLPLLQQQQQQQQQNSRCRGSAVKLPGETDVAGTMQLQLDNFYKPIEILKTISSRFD